LIEDIEAQEESPLSFHFVKKVLTYMSTLKNGIYDAREETKCLLKKILPIESRHS